MQIWKHLGAVIAALSVGTILTLAVIGAETSVDKLSGPRVRAVHVLPAECTTDPAAVLTGPDDQRLRCAAHAYTRACSLGDEHSCWDVRRLARETGDPQIAELARRWAP